MKKVIFGFVATIMFSVNGFSNTPVIENEMKFENEKSCKNNNLTETKSGLNESICSTTCSRTVAGITFTTSAGNWFSSCERAERRCQEKLDQFLGY